MNAVLTVGFVGTMAALVSYPFDFAHTRLAIDYAGPKEARKYTTIWECFRTVSKADRFRVAYQGLPIQVTSSLLYTAAIAAVLPLFETKSTNSTGSAKLAATAAVATAAIMEIVLYPLDTFKRCFQASHKPKYETLYKEIESNRGKKMPWSRIYMAGLPAHLIKVGIMLAVAGPISGYLVPKLQHTKKMLNK